MWQEFESIFYDRNLKQRQNSSSAMAYVVGMVAALGGFLYGYDTGLINSIMEMNYVTHYFPSNKRDFSTHERAIVTAVLSLGTFFGALSAPLISDRYGRKFSIVFSSALVFNAGIVIQLAANGLPLLCVGRAILGIAIGNLSAIVPLYQAEASPKWVRGSVVFTYQWAITWGFLISSAICQGTKSISNSASYRVPIGLQFLWVLILSVTMLFLPESPRFYVQHNDIQKGLNSLSQLRRLPKDNEDLIEELVDIKANFDYENSFGKTSILDCFRSGGGRHKQRLRIITGIGIMTIQQCTGINFIFYYGVRFFASTGVHHYYLMSFITYAVNVIFSIPGILLIDVVGKRKLFIVGAIGMCVADFIIAGIGASSLSSKASSVISVPFSCVFIAFFAGTWGGCSWALVSDIYGVSIRQKAISITAATNWLVNFIFAYITPFIMESGSHNHSMGSKIFFIWGGFNFFGIFFSYFMVYETKGLKLEEIDYMYSNCKNAFMSVDFISTKIDYSKMEYGNGNTYDQNGLELGTVRSINDYQDYLNRFRDDISTYSRPSFKKSTSNDNSNTKLGSNTTEICPDINEVRPTVVAAPFFNEGPRYDSSESESENESTDDNEEREHGGDSNEVNMTPR